MSDPLPGYDAWLEAPYTDDRDDECEDCGRIIGAARRGCRCGVIDEPGYDEDRWRSEVWDR